MDRIGPLRLGDLAAAERIAPSTLTRLVTVLEERGYVERCPVPGDARASTLTIAHAGHEVLERIREQSTILLADRLQTLTAEQRAALAAALPALEQLADADPRDPRSRSPAPPGPGPRRRSPGRTPARARPHPAGDRFPGLTRPPRAPARPVGPAPRPEQAGRWPPRPSRRPAREAKVLRTAGWTGCCGPW